MVALACIAGAIRRLRLPSCPSLPLPPCYHTCLSSRPPGCNDGLGGFDLLDLAVERLPAHPLGLFDVVADAAVSPEPMAELEGTADGPVVGRLALRFVSEPIGPLRGEGEGTCWEVELGNAAAGLGADEPPAPAAKGLRRGDQPDPVLRVVFRTVPLGGGVAAGASGRARSPAWPDSRWSRRARRCRCRFK